MARGGVYDQLGGGFHRYSVDAEWIVPHFEKMSYDNSELLKVYARRLRGVRHRGVRERGARHRPVGAGGHASDPEGGYAASQDADVGLDDDGDYFTWTRDEAAAVLTAEELEVAAAYYDIGTAGEMHHNPAKNVLFVAADRGRARDAGSAARADVIRRHARARAREAARRPRGAPGAVRRPDPLRQLERDDGVGHARAGAVLGDEDARRHALLTLERLRRRARRRGRRRPHAGRGDRSAGRPGAGRGGRAGRPRGDRRGRAWLAWAERLMDRVWTDYWDDRRRAGCSTPPARGTTGPGLLPARAKPVQDAPTPSPNGVAGIVCARLHELTGRRPLARPRPGAAARVRRSRGRARALRRGLPARRRLAARARHPPRDRRRAGRPRRRPDARRRAGDVRAPPRGASARARRRRGQSAAARHGRHGGRGSRAAWRTPAPARAAARRPIPWRPGRRCSTA